MFSNAYYTQLVELKGGQILQTDTAILDDPELRPYVELYARDEARFWADFADAFHRLTWLGNEGGGASASRG